MRPDVLLLDEPTNGIDLADGATFRAALHGFPGAMMLASHDAAFVAELATRALHLDGGRLIPCEAGSRPTGRIDTARQRQSVDVDVALS